jgi:hypothetical protein
MQRVSRVVHKGCDRRVMGGRGVARLGGRGRKRPSTIGEEERLSTIGDEEGGLQNRSGGKVAIILSKKRINIVKN